MPARPRPLLLGHRGARASASVPENTIASFDLCIEHGCDGFEFDVRRTADGLPVVCHDVNFGALNLAEASARDLESPKAQGFLPTLEQVLHRFSPRCFLDIEVKERGLEAQVLELIRRYPPTRGYVVTSFLPEVLLRLRQLSPGVELGLIWEREPAPWQSLPVRWVLPERGLLGSALVAELQKAGKRIGAWTVNDSVDMLRLTALGAEMLISDDTVSLVNTFPVS